MILCHLTASWTIGPVKITYQNHACDKLYACGGDQIFHYFTDKDCRGCDHQTTNNNSHRPPLPVSQAVPVNPALQAQVNVFVPSKQVPPFRHEVGLQSGMSEIAIRT